MDRLSVYVGADVRALRRAMGEGVGSVRAFKHEVDSATRSARHDMERMERGAIAASGAMGKLSRSMAFASTAFLGGAGVALGLKSIIEKTKEAQESTDRLAQTTRNSGVSWAAAGGAIQGVVAKLSALSGFTRGDLRDAFGRFIIQTHNVGEASRLMGIAVNFARGRHIDLATAALAVTKANMGMVGLLRRQGIEIKPVTTAMDALRNSHKHFTEEAKRAAKQLDATATSVKAVGVLQQKYSGQAKVYGESAAGASDRFRLALTQIEVTIGKMLLPTLAKYLNEGAKWLQHLAANKNAQAQVKAELERVGHVLKIVAGYIKDAWGFTKELVGALGGWKNAMVALLAVMAVNKIAGIVTQFASLGRQVKLTRLEAEATSPAMKKAAGSYVASMGVMEAATVGLSATIKQALISTGLGAIIVAVGLVTAYIFTHWDQVKKATVAVARAIKDAFDAVWKWLREAALKTALAVIEPFSHLPGRLGGWARKAKGALHLQLVNMEHDAGAYGQAIGDALGKKTYDATVPWMAKLGQALYAAVNQGVAAGQPLSEHGAGQGIGPGINTAGKGAVQLPTSFRPTHDTDGIAGYQPSIDVPATPGYKVLAPENGQLYNRHFIPYHGGVGGWTVYFAGSETGQRYFLTHLGAANREGMYRRGQVIGLAGKPVNGMAHVHEGILSGPAGTTGAGAHGSPANPYGGGGGGGGPTLADILASGTTKGKKPRSNKPRKPTYASASTKQSLAEQITSAIDEVDPWSALAAKWEPKLKKLRTELAHKLLTTTELDKIRAQYGKIEGIVSKAIERAQKALSVKQAAFSDAWSRFAGRAMSAFDRQTQKMIDKLQQTVAAAHGIVNGATPAEQALAALDRAQAASERASQLADANRGLNVALASGDPEQIAQAQAELERVKSQIALEEQRDRLQAQAEAERAAYDKDLADAQQNAQDKRDIDRDTFETKLEDLKKSLSEGKITVTDFDKSVKDLFSQYGIDFNSLQELGSQFAVGLLDSLGDVEDWAKQVRAILIKYGLIKGDKTSSGNGQVIDNSTVSGGGGVKTEAFTHSPFAPSAASLTIVLPDATIIGSDLTAAAAQLAEPIRRELLRVQRRNGSVLV